MNKQTLRSVYLEKRKLLTEVAYQQRNSEIFVHLFNTFEHQLTKRVHAFMPIAAQREVDTWPIIRKLWEIGSDVCTSRTLFKQNRLEHVPLTPHTLLLQNKWGILEPSEGVLIDPKSINVVLVPLLAFDIAGNRIGYGKGFYDRFLADCKPDVLKIGLSLAPPLDNIDYVEASDIPLDVCVTHQKVYQFTNGKI